VLYLQNTPYSQLTRKQQDAIISAYYTFREDVATNLFSEDRLGDSYANYEDCRHKVARFLRSRVRSQLISSQTQIDIIASSQKKLLGVLRSCIIDAPYDTFQEIDKRVHTHRAEDHDEDE
jgi:hypothetical protein